MNVELVGANGLQRSDDPGQELGPAPRHHSVDGDFFNRHFDQVGSNDSDDVVGCKVGPIEHLQNAFDGGRSDGQAVGDPPVEQHFHFVVEVGQLEVTRSQHPATELGA